MKDLTHDQKHEIRVFMQKTLDTVIDKARLSKEQVWEMHDYCQSKDSSIANYPRIGISQYVMHRVISDEELQIDKVISTKFNAKPVFKELLAVIGLNM